MTEDDKKTQVTLILRDVLRTLRTSPVFSFYVVATLVVAALIGLITVDVIDLGMATSARHRTERTTSHTALSSRPSWSGCSPSCGDPGGTSPRS